MSLDFVLFQKILTSLLLGALIGLEREQTMKKEGGVPSRFAGIRTFILFAILGTVGWIFLEDKIFFWILTAAVLLLIVAAYIISSIKTESAGATTELAAIGIYIAGILVGRGEFILATSLTLLILIILHFKNPLHHFAYRVSSEELTSTVKFMIVAFIILPLLPDKSYGPYDIFNPHLIWLMVVLISGISFASYLAIKFLGEKRGIGLTGFFAGLISSTALALSFSDQSKKHLHAASSFIFALTIASSAMFFRMLVVLSILNTQLLKFLIFPFGVMGLTGFALALFFWKKKGALEQKKGHPLTSHAEKLESPFKLKPALKFGLVFTIILFATKLGLVFLGSEGVYLTSALSGVLDVDAITVSVSKLAPSDLSLKIASLSIFIAAVMNTVSKGAIMFFLGHKRVALPLASVYAVMLIAGGLTLAIML